MPKESCGTVKKKKKTDKITTFRKKPISSEASKALYSIYDSIKAGGKSDNPMAVAMSKWKESVVLKNGSWTLKAKPKKESKKESINPSTVGLQMPAGSAKVGDGSFESFRNMLRDALLALFGKKYLYIVSTFRTKVIVDIDEGNQAGYYEIPYIIKAGKFSFGTSVKVIKLTKFQKAERKTWRDYRNSVSEFVSGNTKLSEVIKSGMRVNREKIK